MSNWEVRSTFRGFQREYKRTSLTQREPAACVIRPAGPGPPGWNAILSEQPKLDFARAAHLLSPQVAGQGLRHPTAIISPDAVIAPNVDIGPYVSVGAGTSIGKGSILSAGVIVGNSCIVGEECILYPHVVLYYGVRLGNGVILHSGAVLGSDGFGYVFDRGARSSFRRWEACGRR